MCCMELQKNAWLLQQCWWLWRSFKVLVWIINSSNPRLLLLSDFNLFRRKERLQALILRTVNRSVSCASWTIALQLTSICSVPYCPLAFCFLTGFLYGLNIHLKEIIESGAVAFVKHGHPSHWYTSLSRFWLYSRNNNLKPNRKQLAEDTVTFIWYTFSYEQHSLEHIRMSIHMNNYTRAPLKKIL